MIYHVTTNEAWEQAKQQGAYSCDSLTIEGFIHTSTITQVAGVYQRYYLNKPNLVVLCIDEDKLSIKPVFEAASNGELYPHIYGTINVDAVLELKEVEVFL
jgi:uncharacterized protein (DUF952 family)